LIAAGRINKVSVIDVTQLKKDPESNSAKYLINTPEEEQCYVDSAHAYESQIYIAKYSPINNRIFRISLEELAEEPVEANPLLANDTGKSYGTTFMDQYLILSAVNQLWFLDINKIPERSSLDFEADYVHASIKFEAHTGHFTKIQRIGRYLALSRSDGLTIVETFK